MEFRIKFVFVLVIPFCPCVAVKVSKACYGVHGLPCTRHNLMCSSGRITIQESFYIGNTACGNAISSCRVDVSSIQLNGTRYNFNDSELESLYGNCSTKPTCSFQAGRRAAFVSFSAIRYSCVNVTTTTATTATIKPPAVSTTVTQGTTTLMGNTPSRSPAVVSPDKTTTAKVRTFTSGTTTPGLVNDNDTRVHTDAESNTGTVVGTITPLCIIIAGVVTAVIIFRRRKLRHAGGNGKSVSVKSYPHGREVDNEEATTAVKGSSDYDYVGGNTYHELELQSMQKGASDYDYAGANNYHELEPLQGIKRSDYDYARCVDQQINNEHSSSRKPQTHGSDYDHIGYQPSNSNDHYDTTLSAVSLKGSSAIDEVYSYNHLNDRKDTRKVIDSTYNTTTSTKHRLDASTNKMEDDYGYNHLGVESRKNLPQNEYDTSASALRDIARMNGDMEDSPYDHAHLVTPEGSLSGMAKPCYEL